VEFENASRDALSAGSHAALRYATTLALTNQVPVTVLHRMPPSSPHSTSHAAIATRPGRSVSREGLDQLIDVQAVAGSSNEELLRAAAETHADLIVLAAGEPSSTSHVCELVHQAPCPVLIVQPSRPAAVA
jgi:nucleotide-binding universal stress UspA family protein